VKLLNDSAKAEIGQRGTIRLDGVNQLVAVMVHIDPTRWASHFVSVGHNTSPLFSGSVERDLLAAIPQGFGHPDKFVQEFINSSNVG
jgi:hypothetical protein